MRLFFSFRPLCPASSSSVGGKTKPFDWVSSASAIIIFRQFFFLFLPHSNHVVTWILVRPSSEGGRGTGRFWRRDTAIVVSLALTTAGTHAGTRGLYVPQGRVVCLRQHTIVITSDSFPSQRPTQRELLAKQTTQIFHHTTSRQDVWKLGLGPCVVLHVYELFVKLSYRSKHKVILLLLLLLSFSLFAFFTPFLFRAAHSSPAMGWRRDLRARHYTENLTEWRRTYKPE